MEDNLLKFSVGNAKLDKFTVIFDLPAGYACPWANECLSKTQRDGKGLKDGKNTKFRCFSANMELMGRNVRNLRWHNFDLIKKLKTKEQIKDLLLTSLITKKLMSAQKIRIHTSGDFFNQEYFDAWMEIAKENPNMIFYAYTKALPLWINRLNDIPSNLRLTASIGGKKDELIKQHSLKYVKVVYSHDEAKLLGLEIDHDDSMAFGENKKPFALLIHGTQPKGSDASKAREKLRELTGFYGYSRKAA